MIPLPVLCLLPVLSIEGFILNLLLVSLLKRRERRELEFSEKWYSVVCF